MIGQILDFLRKTTGVTDPNVHQVTSSMERKDEDWMIRLEGFLAQSESRPRLLVEFVREGIPNNLRGWVWCRILRISNVPGKTLIWDY